MIRVDISRSNKVSALSPKALSLFTLLIPHFNAHGKMNGDPHFIKGEVCPLIRWLSLPAIKKALKEITTNTNVKWFKFDGCWYIHSIKFEEHQELRTDRSGPDLLPSYSGSSPGVVRREVEVEVEVKEEVEVKSIVPRPENVRFTPPTLDEVSEYCKARGNNVDPVKYHAHYTANGWRVGKNPMKNWKAAIVTWERGN